VLLGGFLSGGFCLGAYVWEAFIRGAFVLFPFFSLDTILDFIKFDLYSYVVFFNWQKTQVIM